MENKDKKEFQNSLDLTEEGLQEFVPQILDGLWEIGSMPDYVIEIIGKNIKTEFSSVIDLGCGKGAVLIKLAENFDFNGLGIDIIPEFIEVANNYLEERSLSNKLGFKTEDLVKRIQTTLNQDIVIHGYDSEILGDLKSTLQQLSKCIKRDGYILLEFMFTKNSDNATEEVITEGEMIKIIREAGCHIIDRIDWDKDVLRQTNQYNNAIIGKNVAKLMNLYPEKKEMFEEYLQNQLDECEALENKYTCTTLLLKKIE